MAQIWCCCGCGVGWQLQLGLTPSLGTSICFRCPPPKKKKKKKSCLLCYAWYLKYSFYLYSLEPCHTYNCSYLFERLIVLVVVFLFWFFCLFRATSTACGGSQNRGLIGATAAGLRHNHSNLGSEPSLQPTPQPMATLDP